MLTAITRGFRDLLDGRGELREQLVVRTMVPISIRRPDQRGSLNNQVTAVFIDLPVGEPDPLARLASLRKQMDDHKRMLGARTELLARLSRGLDRTAVDDVVRAGDAAGQR